MDEQAHSAEGTIVTNLTKHSTLALACAPLRKASMLALFLATTLVTTKPAQTQTFTVLHEFTGGEDGEIPYSGLTLDRAGNVYGTTTYGADQSCLGGCGTVFRISRAGAFTTLYRFHGIDGDGPEANVTIASDDTLYGTTEFGGAQGTGNIYRLQPSTRALGNATGTWNETVIHTFGAYNDGEGVLPWWGALIFDRAGNLYGTASAGGTGSCASGGCGTVFELSPSNGGWTYNVLYRFTCTTDGATPFSGVVMDTEGRLYGTTDGNLGCDGGTAYQLAPTGSGWTEITMHQFQNRDDGGEPVGGLVVDAAANAYGVTANGGTSGCGGVVYELSPRGVGWTFLPIYCLVGPVAGGSESAMTMDAAGNLYGTTTADGANRRGSVFKLTYNNGSWTYTDLHDFTGGADGSGPVGTLAVDADGNIYGTSVYGGTGGGCEFGDGCGVAWKITP